MNKIDKEKEAENFAAQAHEGQKHGKRPYIQHPREVAGILKEFGYSSDENLILAGWLHDTIEDTSVTFEDVEEKFGKDVAELVDYVTQREGHNRKTRIALTYPHTRKSSRAVALKISDRIANVRHTLDNEGKESGFYEMYLKEYPGFKDNLYKANEHETLWDALDTLMS